MQKRIAVEPLQLMYPATTPRLQLLQPVKITAEQGIDNEILTEHDLTQFSNYLAREMSYKPFHAAYEPPSWYRAQVGEDICSEAQASLLRTMTIRRCNQGAGKRDEDLCAPSRWSESTDALGMVVMMILLVVFVGLIEHVR